MRLGGHTITIVRPTTKNPLGDYRAGTPVETVVTGCYVQRRASAGSHTSHEETGLRDTVITDAIVYAPAGTDLRATDRIIWNGNRYQADGDPTPWDDINGNPHHVEAQIRIVEG